MSDILSALPSLSDDALHYITEVVDKWPTTNGFPRPPQGKHVDDSIAQEINTFVRKANMHLAQLFQEAEDASEPKGYLTDMPDYAEPHKQKSLADYVKTRMHGKSVNASTFPHRVNDLLRVNNVVVGLKTIIAKYEAEEGEDAAPVFESLTPAAQIANLHERLSRIEKEN